MSFREPIRKKNFSPLSRKSEPNPLQRRRFKVPKRQKPLVRGSPEEQKAFLQQKLEQSAFVGYNGLNVPVNVPKTPPPQPVQKQPASEALEPNIQQPEVPEVEATSDEEEETVQPKELSASPSPNPESPNTEEKEAEEKEEDVTPNQQSEAGSTHSQSQKPDLQARKEKASRLSSNWLTVPVNTPGTQPSPVQRTLSTSGLEHQYQPQIGQRANSVLNGLNQFKAQQLAQDYSVQRQDSSGESQVEESEETQPESLHNQPFASSPPDNPEDDTASGSDNTPFNLQLKNNKEQKPPQQPVQSDGAIQAKCSECEQPEEQEEKDESVQTKLTIGEPGDKYEQEADTMAAKVMAMPDSTLSQSVQRQTEAEKPPLAKSISSLVQRSASDTTQASPSIENRLASSQGGGNPLPENVRSFMEPRFGADFSPVRVHTDSTAVQMNKELGAQAFTHGSNIYYGAGKSPNADELTAHELTHTIQQGAAKTLQEKPLTSLSSNKKSIQTKINPAQSPNLKSTSAVQVQDNSQQQSLNNKDLGASIQMKCATCAADEQKEEQIQRKSLAENITPKDNKAVQKWGWDDVTNTLGSGVEWAGDKLSSGAQWVGDKVGDVASMGKDAFAALVARVAPGLANLIRQGPVGILSEKIKEGVKGWLSGVMANVDIGSVITGLKSSFAGVFATIQGLGKGDPASCKAFANSIKSLQELGQAFMDNPVIKQLQTAFTTVSGTFKKVTELVIAPAFDTLMNVAGGVFNAVKGLATTIWEWGAPVRNTLGAAWDWVKQQLGFGGDGEGGILEWLKTKASEVWEQIKVTFAPVIEPLKKVGTVLLAFSPVGIIAAVVKFVPQLVKSVQWLWAHKDDPNIVKSAHEQMGNTILPQLLSAVQGFSQAVQSTVTSLVNQAVQLSEAVLGLLGAVTGVPLLSAAQSLVQAVSDGVKELVTWGQQSFQAAAKAVQEAFVKIKAKIEPYAGVLSSLALAIVNPAMIPVILAGSAWRMLDDCYKLPIIDFLLDVVIGLLEAAPSLPMFGLLWPMLKAGVLGFLKGVKAQPADTKVAITNKLAKIISGGSPAFILGFVKGLLKGIWEGLTDPFVLMYEGIKGLGNLISWLNDTANQALSPQPAAQSTATDQTAAASSDAGVDKVVIGQTLQQMGTELQPPAEQVTGGFMPAVQEAFSGGEGLTFEGLMQKLGEAWAAVESAITNAGGQLAQKVCEFMMQDTAEGQMGETVGWLAGTIAFEVALGILTAGSVTAAKGAMKVLKIFAKVLDWTGEALGLAFKGLAKLGGFVLDIVKGIGKLLSNAGGAAKSVLGALGEIGEILTKYADELLGKVGKGAAEQTVKQGTGEIAEKFGEQGLEFVAKYGDEGAEFLIHYGDDALQLADEKVGDFLRWKKRLTPETQQFFKDNPDLWRVYADMNPDVRKVLTLCNSPCIPSKATTAQAERIEGLLSKSGLAGDHPGLKKYFHSNKDLDAAISQIDDLADHINGNTLDVLLNNKKALETVWRNPDAAALLGKHGDNAVKALGILGDNGVDILKKYDNISHIPGASEILKDLTAGKTTTKGAIGEIKHIEKLLDEGIEIAKVGDIIGGKKAADIVLKNGKIIDVKYYDWKKRWPFSLKQDLAKPLSPSKQKIFDRDFQTMIDEMIAQVKLRKDQYPGAPIEYAFKPPLEDVPDELVKALEKEGVQVVEGTL
ncbi:eCIS core domain-containing protein [Coleofasciculus sp. E2-BRE-01]|uniref:eCIS core domain-containing protein n=1 Tax=Coleofasciculus sp. E2-BRE-01 TaxID=3069524 RepID=UPI0033041C50